MKSLVSWAVILAFVAAGVLAANIEVPEDSLNPDNFDPGIAKSDDFLAHKVLFLDAAENLKIDFACTRKHFADNAGFARSASTAKRYFTYCGNNDRIDLTIIDETEYYINRNGSARRQYSVKQVENRPSKKLSSGLQNLKPRSARSRAQITQPILNCIVNFSLLIRPMRDISPRSIIIWPWTRRLNRT